ncbi:MAG TPA: NAD(P)/FAD-dependent oxidoreductase [Gemmatimonadaceae bacterium]|nr:NAD(P)/FAD-dependent oxidoreductase [Gemmatimonadaceae bacterium]
MPSRFDAVVIGAGANGLTAAATLAKHGQQVLLVDGANALTPRSRALEFAPGFRCAPLMVDAGWAPPAVLRELGINAPSAVVPRYSVSVAQPGMTLALANDSAAAADAIRSHSTHDGDEWAVFVTRLRAMSGFLESLYQLPAPDIDTTKLGEIMPLVGAGRKFRALGRAGMMEMLRVLPMPARDYLEDEFQSEVVRAAVGAGAVRDMRQGPRSGGTMFNLLHYLTGAPGGSVRARAWWQDGPDAFTRAAEGVTRARGVTIRTGHAAVRVLVRDHAVSGVVLDDADEIFASTVVSTVDPAHTLLHLVDPVWLDPQFIRAVRNIRFRGCTAFVQYAVDKLPDLPGLDGVVTLTGDLTSLERAYDAAKYGRMSERPHVELTATTLRWPSHAPQGKHVVVARVQYVPYEAGISEDALAGAVTSAIAGVVPGFPSTVLHHAVITPEQLERNYGLAEGAVTHGELALDQVLFMRPVPGFARHAMPIRGLYLGGAGAHPGPGVLGMAGLLAAKAVLR